MSTGCTAFTTSHRVINRVHYNTSVVRADTEPTLASGLSMALQTVIRIGHNTDCSTAGNKHHTCLT